MLQGEQRQTAAQPENIPERHRSVLREVAVCVVAAVLSLALASWVLRVSPHKLRIPMGYEGDALFHAMIIKGMIEHGWYLTNDSIGMPGGLRLHDFPAGDTLCCVLIKLLTIGTSTPFLIENIFFLLTFPLTAITSVVAMRHLGISRGPAVLGSALYALLPYHFFRGTQHLFYSAYFLVPLAVLVAVWVASGRLLNVGDGFPRPLLRQPRVLFSLGTCLLLGCNMAYYPFFAAYLIAVAALVALLTRGDRLHFFAGSAMTVVIVATIVLNLLPNLLYLHEHGRAGLTVRPPQDSEVYGLKIAQLLLPIPTHRIPRLAAISNNYRANYPLVNENFSASLGVLGSVGFLALLGWLLFGTRHPGPARNCFADLADRISVLNLAAVLLGTIGGFSSLFALLVFANIRAYNRISTFVAFFSFLALCLALELAARRYAKSRAGNAVFHGSLGMLLFLGILDQTSPQMAPDYIRLASEMREQQRFFKRVETLMPPGSMIFQLPYMSFPENGPVNKLGDYIHLRAYLHTHSLRWSYGAMKGRPTDLWQREVASLPPAEFLRRIAAAGFTGVCLNRAGFTNGTVDLEAELRVLAGVEPLIDEKQELVFYDISRFAGTLAAQSTPAQWQAEREQLQHDLEYPIEKNR